MVIRALLLFLLSALPLAAQDSLRLIVPPMRPVVGEMIPVTIRGEYKGAITLENMQFPDSTAYDWIQVARDRWADERVEGRLRRVFERRIAVFPRAAGTLTIGPVVHSLTKAQGTARLQGDVTASPVVLSVLAYPGSGRPLAARHVTVKDEYSADPASLRPGQTFTRRLTLTAEGSMDHLLPPRPDIRGDGLVSLAAPEIRETRLTAEGPVAVAIWEWSLRSQGSGSGSGGGALTPIQFVWFNTLIREMRGAVTLPVQVGPAGSGLDGAARPPAGMAALAAAIGGIALLAGLAAGLPGTRLATRRQVLRRLHRGLPNPHRHALRQAAAAGDLWALRRAAQDYAAHERAAGRSIDAQALATLDRALFAARPPPFDPMGFARRLQSRPARQ
ncbi:Oxygen tolerance [Paracoccus thiocyanatus]|uniref:Oxygen tolerance n=1 Tax=Paracoccus thiocyanatus TaxID=34006 RepID=A0A1N6WJE8_9RHOB|nr:BatD family protein [Paracoccus thiocyanatus]SIQ90116.1 Oxygen tolerance [Paracoccus thiocyanatus]